MTSRIKRESPAIAAEITGSAGPAISAIVAISALASVFLFWLIYFHSASDASNTQFVFLPALNAVLNGLSATSLLIGFRFIKARRIPAHRSAMLVAFVFSSIFLISYVANHALHGESHYPGHGTIKIVFDAILISHIFLSVVGLPLVLITFFYSLTGRFPQHRRIARYTFPIWLYVSVTGVVVYAMLAAAH